jgi:hypothetical protein
VKGEILRGKKADGGCREDSGPPMLLAIMSPPGGAACGK